METKIEMLPSNSSWSSVMITTMFGFWLLLPRPLYREYGDRDPSVQLDIINHMQTRRVVATAVLIFLWWWWWC